MEIDHIGFVVKNIDEAIKYFTNIYGYSLRNQTIYDETQRVKLAMLRTPNEYHVELIEPINANSPSYDFMLKGGGLHHFCYITNNIEKTIKILKTKNHILIQRPVMAPLLENRKMAFLFSKTYRHIIELVEKK